MSIEKNAKIKSSIKSTKERHKLMDCHTYEVKVVDSKLSRAQRDGANTCFRETKWRRNDCVANWGNISRDKKSASVKVGDKFEERMFTTIGGQVVQDIYDEVKKNINELHDKKQKGYKVGKLKFKSVCDCVPLRQHGVTFTVDRKHNRVKVTKIKKPFYVRGLKQIPEDADIASAQFIRKPSGLYFHITVYEYPKDREKTNKQVGLDFGIEHNLTTSDWDYFDVDVPESKGLKLSQRRFNRSYVKNGKTKSKSHYKRLNKGKRQN